MKTVIVCLFACCAAVALIGSDLRAAQSKAVEASAGEPAVVPRAYQYDIRSRMNGQTYRVSVALPPGAEPGIAYPALYVLDAQPRSIRTSSPVPISRGRTTRCFAMKRRLLSVPAPAHGG